MPKAKLNVVNAPELGDSLRTFAADLIREVKDADTETRLAAFKALSQFYIATTKLGDKVPQDDDEPGGLPAMRAALKAVGNE
jgi:hypothetical protein